jgi:hypothetical protein
MSQIFTKLLQNCCNIEVYIYIFFSHIYWLVIIYFPVPRIVKIVKIVLTGSYLLEYSIAWCIMGEREFS